MQNGRSLVDKELLEGVSLRLKDALCNLRRGQKRMSTILRSSGSESEGEVREEVNFLISKLH
jgi:hypothetical protein